MTGPGIVLIPAASLSVRVVGTVEAWRSPPRVRLDVLVTAEGYGPIPEWSVRIDRVHPDGSVWPVLIDPDARLLGGGWTGFDYHAPIGVAVSYRAHVTDAPVLDSGTVRLVTDGQWLVHATDPALSVRLDHVRALGDPTYGIRAGTFTVVGSQRPVTVTDGSGSGPTSSITFAVAAGQLAALVALLRDAGPLLINLPAAPGWDVTWQWTQRTGDLTVTNPGSADSAKGGGAGYPYRVVTMAYAAIDPPDVTTGALWTYPDVGATFANYTELAAAYETYTGLMVNVRGT